jgi:hypothetical protein
LERAMRARFSKWRKTPPAVFQVLFTFVVVSLCWVVFRADSLGEAGDYYAALFGGLELVGPDWWTRSLILSWETGAILVGAALVTWMGVSASQFVVDSKGWKWFVLTVLFWSCLIAMGAQEGNPFLYYFF